MTLIETWTELDLGGVPESVAFTVKFSHSIWKKWEISCQFLPPGGSIGPGYVLQLFFMKNHKIVNNSATAEKK
jgi:hypothetical protein